MRESSGGGSTVNDWSFSVCIRPFADAPGFAITADLTRRSRRRTPARREQVGPWLRGRDRTRASSTAIRVVRSDTGRTTKAIPARPRVRFRLGGCTSGEGDADRPGRRRRLHANSPAILADRATRKHSARESTAGPRQIVDRSGLSELPRTRWSLRPHTGGGSWFGPDGGGASAPNVRLPYASFVAARSVARLAAGCRVRPPGTERAVRTWVVCVARQVACGRGQRLGPDGGSAGSRSATGR